MGTDCTLRSRATPSPGEESPLQNQVESLAAGCDRIVVDVRHGSVEAILDHPDAPNDIWAFGIVRREITLGSGAWVYLDGFGRLRRIRVRFDAPAGWLPRLRALGECTDDELRAAEHVERIVETFEVPRRAMPPARPADPRSLVGRVALVTGASRGIGASAARRLAAAGATVICVARTLEGHPSQSCEAIDTKLADTLAVIRAHGGTAEPLLADLSQPDIAEHLVAQVIETWGRLDVLVNNAARGMYRAVDDWQATDVRKLFQVNALAPFALARTAIPHMRARGSGAIVNISSIVADAPIGPPYGLFERQSFTTVYGMAKAALNRMSTGLAIECCEHGVQINSLSPSGGVRTPGALAASGMFNRFPEFAEPQETMAEAVLALCEPRTPMITGRVLTSGALLADLGREVRGLDGGQFTDDHAVIDLREPTPTQVDASPETLRR